MTGRLVQTRIVFLLVSDAGTVKIAVPALWAVPKCLWKESRRFFEVHSYGKKYYGTRSCRELGVLCSEQGAIGRHAYIPVLSLSVTEENFVRQKSQGTGSAKAGKEYLGRITGVLYKSLIHCYESQLAGSFLLPAL